MGNPVTTTCTRKFREHTLFVLSLRERVDRRTKLHEHIKGLKKIFFRPPG